MEEIVISLETAKLAKEKGFKEKCFAYWVDLPNMYSRLSKKEKKDEHLDHPSLVYKDFSIWIHQDEKRNNFVGGDSYEYYIRDIKYHSVLENFNEGGCYRDYWYSAPTQSFLQKWLREKHDIHIVIQESVNIDTRKMRYYPVLLLFGKQYDETFGPLGVRCNGDGHTYLGDVWKNIYEEALEVGLLEALKLISK